MGPHWKQWGLIENGGDGLKTAKWGWKRQGLIENGGGGLKTAKWGWKWWGLIEKGGASLKTMGPHKDKSQEEMNVIYHFR